MSLYVPETHTKMDGTFYGPVCQFCKRGVAWGSGYPIERCYIAWNTGSTPRAIEGCAFDSLDEHDKRICRELLDFFNTDTPLPVNDWEHVCEKDLSKLDEEVN